MTRLIPYGSAAGPAGTIWQFDNLSVATDPSPFEQPVGQVEVTPQGPTLTTGGQIMGMTDQGKPVAGAIEAVAVDPTNPNVLFVGTVNGGIWRTDNINAMRHRGLRSEACRPTTGRRGRGRRRQ